MVQIERGGSNLTTPLFAYREIVLPHNVLNKKTMFSAEQYQQAVDQIIDIFNTSDEKSKHVPLPGYLTKEYLVNSIYIDRLRFESKTATPSTAYDKVYEQVENLASLEGCITSLRVKNDKNEKKDIIIGLYDTLFLYSNDERLCLYADHAAKLSSLSAKDTYALIKSFEDIFTGSFNEHNRYPAVQMLIDLSTNSKNDPFFGLFLSSLPYSHYYNYPLPEPAVKAYLYF